MIYEFIKRLIDDERRVRAICLEFDNDILLPSGSGISIFKYLIINKVTVITILERIDIDKHIEFEYMQEGDIKNVESIDNRRVLHEKKCIIWFRWIYYIHIT
jgi:hypothetical protein